MSKDNQKITGDSVYRVKMYKDGKKWVAAGATTLALLAGLSLANVNASADTTNNGGTQVEEVQDGTKSNTGASSAPETAAKTDTNVQTKTVDKTSAAPAASGIEATSAKVDTNTAAKPAADDATKDATAPKAADTAVSQAAPTVTTPTSQAEVKVSQDAQVEVASVAPGKVVPTDKNSDTVAKNNDNMAGQDVKNTAISNPKAGG